MKVTGPEWLLGLDRIPPLVRPLQRGEDPGSVRKRGGKRGAPDRPTLLLEAAGLDSDLVPPVVRLLIYKRALRSLSEDKPAGKILNVETRARLLLKQRTLAGWRNPIQLRDRDTITRFARALKDDYSHLERFNKRNEPLVQAVEATWSQWRRFEPLIIELMPMCMEAFLTSNASGLWDNLFASCAYHYALLDFFKKYIQDRYGSAEYMDATPKLKFHVVKGTSALSAHIFRHLPTRDQLLTFTEPGVAIRFDLCLRNSTSVDPDELAEMFADDSVLMFDLMTGA
jgi:hypothetical protein